jgi:hypothetical protein
VVPCINYFYNGAEENNWTEEGWSDRKVEKTA